jgi:glyoxylase-like metal-dependent hydrolase (beta-lactamase superfamily II)
MPRCLGLSVALLVMLQGGACARPRPALRAPPSAAAAPAAKQVPALEVRPLTAHIFLHRSYKEVEGFGVVGSNGLLVQGGEAAFLVDTAFTEADTRALLERAEHDLGVRVAAALITHAHDDRLGGLTALGTAQTYALGLTRERARAAQKPVPSQELPAEGSLRIDDVTVQFFHPGPAHAPDNIVVYLPEQRVLFGGCMVRAAGDGLGNLGDANLASWRDAITRVMERYPEAERVIPGHGEPGGRELLTHTLELLDRARP